MFHLFFGSFLFCGPDLRSEYLIGLGFSPGPAEMLLILVVALLLYGGRLPEMARTWGKTLAELRRSLSGIQNEFNEAMYNAKDHLAIDQKEWRGEEDRYSDDSVNETSGYDEESQDDFQPEDDTTTNGSSGDETSSDTEATEELSSEKQSRIESE